MAIEFKKVGYIYDAGMPYAHVALKDIDLSFREGVITAVIGETGSGKSTLTEHLNALLLPTSGEIEILDHQITSGKKNKDLKSLRKDVGLVFQFSEYQLFEETILKDVSFGPKNFGYSEEEATERAKAALKLVGINESFYEKNPLDLSGGQKRRVAIAGILAIDPKVIVLDEPTAGLDPKGARDIIGLFVELNRTAKKTIIVVTHDNEMVYNYCDDTVLMSHGEVIYHGLTTTLFNDQEMLKQYDVLEPQIVTFRNMLINKGFNIADTSRTIEAVVADVSRGIRR